MPNSLPFYENSIILCSTETKCVKLKRYSNQKRYLKTETKLKNMKYKHHLLSLCGVAIAVLCVFSSCKENIDTSARYVFKYNTVYSYLQKHEAYSEYVSLLEKVNVSDVSDTKVSSLLSARGHYTCFAPSNEAIQQYLEELCEKDSTILPYPSWDAFTDSTKLDSIRKVIVFNSIIDGGLETEPYTTAEFPTEDKAEFVMSCLNDKKLSVHYITNRPDSIYINMDCPISETQRDIVCINGVIHQMEKTIAPSGVTCTEYINDYLEKGKDGYRTCFRVLKACGLLDTLSKVRDEVYEKLYITNRIPNLENMTGHGFAEGSIGYAPKHRLYGFTIFAETDDFWRSQGIDPDSENLFQELIQWIIDNDQYSKEDEFVTDENYTSEKNLLYQWITYHILPCKISSDKLVIHNNEKGYNIQNKNLTIAQDEFYATMGKRRLLKIFESKESNGVYLNRFPKLDNGRRGTYHELYCDEDKVGCLVDNKSDSVLNYNVLNGIVYGIDAPLAYTDEVRNNLQRQRIRFESMTMFPEAMTNDIRKCQSTDFRHQFIHIPPTSKYQYFENMDLSDDTWFVYLNSYGYDWCNLNADELKAEGRYEVTLKLPPVPRSGVYELRYKVLANGDRGTAQFYLGTDKNKLAPTRIPIDLTLATPEKTGWFTDSDDDEYNAEKDKQMRNNGIMKGAEGIQNSSATERATTYTLRHIVSRQFVDADKTYYLRIKSVLDSDRKEFYMDYLEWVSKDVYDNPVEPEDIW